MQKCFSNVCIHDNTNFRRTSILKKSHCLPNIFFKSFDVSLTISLSNINWYAIAKGLRIILITKKGTYSHYFYAKRIKHTQIYKPFSLRWSRINSSNWCSWYITFVFDTTSDWKEKSNCLIHVLLLKKAIYVKIHIPLQLTSLINY